MVIDAVVYNITPFAVYLNLIGDKVKAKLTIDELLKKRIEGNSIQVGSVMTVKIKHISLTRIVVEETSGNP